MFRFLVAIFLMIFSHVLKAEEVVSWPDDSKTPESLVAALYESVSADPLVERNWARFDNLFYPDARLSFATEYQGTVVLKSKSPKTLANDIQTHYLKMGFHEVETKQTIEQHDLMANVTSYFDVKIGKKTNGTLFSGVNHFQLLYDGNRWWILSNTGTILSK